MDKNISQFFARAKAVALTAGERFSILKQIQGFMTFHPVQPERQKEFLEIGEIFFARFSDERDIKLTAEEKDEMRAKLVAYMTAHPRRSEVRRVWYRVSDLFRQPVAVFAASLLLFLSGGGVIYASRGALPGDILYPVKVAVFDEVPALLVFTEESRIKWEGTRAERRLAEAEELAAGGLLDKKAADILERDLNMRVARISRWESKAKEEHATLAEGVHESLLRVRTLTGSYLSLHEALAGTTTDFRQAAEEALSATETRIAELRVAHSKGKNLLLSEVSKDIRTRLRTADKVIVEGRGRMRAEDYREAYVLFQEANILADEAEKLLPAN